MVKFCSVYRVFFAFFTDCSAALSREINVVVIERSAAAGAVFQLKRITGYVGDFKLKFDNGKQKLHFVFGF